MVLAELRDTVQSLPGIGSRRAEQLQRLGIISVADLLQHVPRRYEDRSRISTLAESAQNGEGLVEAQVVDHEWFPYRRERILKIIIRDESSSAALVCFGRSVLGRMFPPGTELRIWGQFSLRRGELQSSTFEAQRIDPSGKTTPPLPGFVPIYPLTEGITQQIIRRAIMAALDKTTPFLEDELPEYLRVRENMLSIDRALRELHAPKSPEEAKRAYHRLVVGELFVFQMMLARAAMARRQARRKRRPAPTRSVVTPVRSGLPFSLTADQESVLREILADMRTHQPMARMLQGDVGSGKTIIALLAASVAVERGEQVALMVPTELLARQHAENTSRVLDPGGVTTTLVLGSLTPGERKRALHSVTDGSTDVVVGTHALFSDDVKYRNLGLIIIDEQHRFGVRQREQLLSRGNAPDVLMMSATPIPRSLALTAFGDTEISTINTLPPGRRPVKTRLVRMGNEERAYAFVRERIEEGRQAYLVYPAIDGDGERGLRNVENMYRELSSRLAPHPVGLVHSRLDNAERAAVMDSFAAGTLAALVATSVVEVGVDIPNATVMVIEHAELFGLAALHQLRGRVGRGKHQSYCILVYQDPVSDDARERLRVLFQSNDGFLIAEEDLRIRGPGDMPGVQTAVRQSGFLSFRFADIRRDMPLMLTTRDWVRQTLEHDPGLIDPAHETLARALPLSVAGAVAGTEADRPANAASGTEGATSGTETDRPANAASETAVAGTETDRPANAASGTEGADAD